MTAVMFSHFFYKKNEEVKSIPTQQMIDIIIKAKDQASETANKVDQKLKKFYNNVSKANDKAAKSSQKFNAELLRAGESFQVVGGGATQAAQMMQRVKMDPNFGTSIERAKLQVSQMGYNINSLEGKVRVFGAAVPMVFNKLKTQVSSAASTLKGKLAGAIDSVRQKLASLASGAKQAGSAFSALKGIMGMMVGMIGYDLFNGLIQSARASINAASQVEYFGQRLNKMTGETHLSAEGFKTFKNQLGELQKEFRKVDMTAVGATAEELTVKLNLPAEKMGDLTRMTAVLSSTFVKEGRSQEDAVLAVSDALDGQFKRLQEIGISQQTLIDNGWSGDIEDQTTLIDALNKSLKDMGYEQTAKDITNLDEAWGALTIAGGQLLQKVLVPITPVIIRMVDAFMRVADAIGPIVERFVGFVSNMPDWAKYAGLVVGFSVAVNMLADYITLTLIPALADAALAALDFAIAMMANPLTWIAAALAVVAIAVYEVGKSFGWWTDVGSMLQAVWAGIQRLWSAFINHPDVQGIIGAIKSAWDALQPAIQSVVSWVGSFFQSTNGSKFDAVRVLIDALGVAWKAMTLPIRLVITVVKLFMSTMKTVYNNVRNIINNIRNLWQRLPGLIRGAISSLVHIITQPFRNAYSQITGIVGNIKSAAQGITNINLSSITNKIVQPFVNAYNRVAREVDKIKAKANSITGGALSAIGLGFDYEGMLEELNQKSNTYTTSSSEDININHQIDFLFDFRNLPEGTSEETLVRMLQSAITDKSVINQLVNSPDFQSLDGKVKNRIMLKQGRARGA